MESEAAIKIFKFSKSLLCETGLIFCRPAKSRSAPAPFLSTYSSSKSGIEFIIKSFDFLKFFNLQEVNFALQNHQMASFPASPKVPAHFS